MRRWSANTSIVLCYIFLFTLTGCKASDSSSGSAKGATVITPAYLATDVPTDIMAYPPSNIPTNMPTNLPTVSPSLTLPAVSGDAGENTLDDLSSKDLKEISLNRLPKDYSLEDAKADETVIFENGDITHGQSMWENFVESSKNGEAVTVRLGYYYTLEDASKYDKEYYESIKDDYPILYIMDLYYDKEKYTIEWIEEGKLISKEYKYLIKCEGEPNSETAVFSQYTYYILVNDNTVTWEEIVHGMLSSQFGNYIDHFRVYSDLIYK